MLWVVKGFVFEILIGGNEFLGFCVNYFGLVIGMIFMMFFDMKFLVLGFGSG